MVKKTEKLYMELSALENRGVTISSLKPDRHTSVF